MKKLQIVFFHIGTPCNGETPRCFPLGGTESAMISMAEALALRGHHVTVFTKVTKEGDFFGVRYLSFEKFESYAERNEIDVFIGLRFMLPHLLKRWGKVQIYFSPDAYDQPFINAGMQVHFSDDNQEYNIGLFSLKLVKKYVDSIFCVGSWQKKTFQDRFHIPEDNIYVAANGVDLKYFGGNVEKKKNRIVYASTPYRGLEYLLKYFPEIKKSVPDVELIICSGMQIYGQSQEEDQKAYGVLHELAKQPGVIWKTPLSKPELAQVLEESTLMAYPNTFAETFCMAVLEGQAAGLPIVTTRLAGLIERVSDGVDGYLIPGHPRDESYQRDFIDKVVSVLTNVKDREKMSYFAREKASLYSYEVLAEKWEEKFNNLLQNKKVDSLHPYCPSDQKISATVNGYPKEIVLSAKMIRKYLAQEAYRFGFTHLSHELSNKE